MFKLIKHALMGETEGEVSRRRERERRKHNRIIAQEQQRLQTRETGLTGRVQSLVASGKVSKARQTAKELTTVRTDLVHIERHSRQLAAMDSRANKAHVGRQMNKMLREDVAYMRKGMGTSEHMQTHSDLQEYASLSARADMMEGEFDDILESTLGDECDSDDDTVEDIITEAQDTLAMAMNAPVMLPKEQVAEISEDTDSAEALRRRFERLQALPTDPHLPPPP